MKSDRRQSEAYIYMLIGVNGEKSSTVENNLVEIFKKNSLIPRRYLNYLL